MVAVITALFFACAAAFAVATITRSFAGAADRFDALFAQYRAFGDKRMVEGTMRPAVRFNAAPAPDYAPRTLVARSVVTRPVVPLNVRAARPASVSRTEWRAAA